MSWKECVELGKVEKRMPDRELAKSLETVKANMKKGRALFLKLKSALEGKIR